MKSGKPEKMTFNDMMDNLEVSYNDEPEVLEAAIDRAIEQAVKSAIRNNGASAVTIKIVVKADRENSVIAKADVTTKLPKPKDLPIRLFVDNRGNLFEEDPHQSRLPNIVPMPERAPAAAGG